MKTEELNAKVRELLDLSDETYAEVARRSGINKAQLHKWATKYHTSPLRITAVSVARGLGFEVVWELKPIVK